jgi:dihydroorotate dehydrogenase electron transfer subunit
MDAGCALLARSRDAYLRRTWWPCAIDAHGFAVLLEAARSAGLREGEPIDVLGPIGRGFRVAEHTRRLLLVAAESNACTPMLAPLLPLLDRALAANCEAALAYAAPHDTQAYPLTALSPALEVIRAEDDLLAQMRDAILWADQIFCCGAREFTEQVSSHVAQIRLHTRKGFVQTLNPIDLPCGVGVCRGCWIGSRLACSDGPVRDV